MACIEEAAERDAEDEGSIVDGYSKAAKELKGGFI